MIATTTRTELLQSLKRQLRQISAHEIAPGDEPQVNSTGFTAVDALLPQKGIPKGGLTEWLTSSPGAGAATLALAGVRAALHPTEVTQHPGYWVVIDSHGDFFPPALMGWGIAPERLVLVRPASARDAAWAFEQALRCPGVAITWNWIGPVSERVLQRWKVAAEVGRGQGVLFRSEQALRQASWADVRWLVQPIAGRPDAAHSGTMKPGASRRLHLKLAYCRGALGGEQVELECHDETGLVRVVPQLADSTPRRQAARA